MAIPISYNVRNIIQRPVSTITTALGIGLTVAIFVGALALAEGFRAALTSTGSAHNVMVLRKGADSEISSGISREAVGIIRAHPAVALDASGRPAVSAEIVVVTNQDRVGQAGSSNVNVRGVDPAAIGVRADVKIDQGRMFTPGTDEVIVGKRISSRFANSRVGDQLRFKQRDFKVVGRFTAAGSAFESEIWGDAAVLGPALDREGVFQSVTFRMREPAGTAGAERDSALARQVRAIKTEFEADPRLQAQVVREDRFYAAQSELLTNVIRFMGIFITAIMALGAMFGAMNTMYAAVSQRTREIATLLVLGFRPLAVMTSFMIESVLLALAGGIVGCLLALTINGITTSTTNFQSFSEVAFAFQVTPAALLAGLVFAVVMGIGGGFFPSLRAARQSLATSLREG